MMPAQFHGDVAGMLEIFAIAAGLVLLYQAGKAGGAGLLKAAGWILIIGGVAVGLCTIYFGFSCHSRGYFRSMHGGYFERMHPGMGTEGGYMPRRMLPPGHPGDSE